MPPASRRRARRIALPAMLWGTIAVGCLYPELSSSPAWDDEAAAGADASAGSGGSSSGDGGRANDAGSSGDAGAEPGPAGSGGEGGAPGPDIIQVTVVDQDGEPMAGVPVLIDDLQLETDPNGKASTPGEDRESFRATLIETESKTVLVYEGLTRRALHFVLPRVQTTGLETGSLQGTIVTPVSEENLNVTFAVQERSVNFFGLRDFTDAAPDVSYEINPSWSGGTLNGTVYGFNWMIGAGFSVPSLFYFGSTPATLAPDATVKDLNFSLAELATRELSVEITVPAGATRSDFLLLGPFTVSNLTPPPSLLYVLPDDALFDDAAESMQFLTTCSFGAAGGPSSSIIVPLNPSLDSIEERCSAPPELTQPPDKAPAVQRTTPLAFAPAEAGCHSVFATHVGLTWNITVYTLATEVVLPDLSAWGLDYAGQEVDWTASTVSPCATIDDFVASAPGEPGEQPTTFFSRSAHRTFVTAP